MKYQKPPLSLNDQVSLLESRGLTFNDRPRAKRYLQFISYYRLSGYFIPHQIPGDSQHSFLPGTCFNDILQLYIFDRKLRILTMNALERIEIAFKAAILNEMAAIAGPHWYVEKNNFIPRYNHNWLINRVKNDTGLHKPSRRNRSCAHYYNTYTDPKLPPIWVVADVLSMGTYAIMFEQLSLKPVKKKTARCFNMAPPDLSSWMRSLTTTRNICAHHSRLWNKTYTIRPTSIKRLKPLLADNTKFYAQAVIMQDMLSSITNSSTWSSKLAKLLRTSPLCTNTHMGFPPGWETDSFWKLT